MATMITDERPEKCLCVLCGRPFAGIRQTTYAERSNHVGGGVYGQGGAHVPEDLQALRGVDGRGQFVTSQVGTQCLRCQYLDRYRYARKLGHRSRDIHRTALMALGKKLMDSTDPIAVLEAGHLRRIIAAHPEGDWISMDDIAGHPSASHLAHLLPTLRTGSNPDAAIDLGSIEFCAIDGQQGPYISAVVERLEHGDFGAVEPDVKLENEATLAAKDGLLRGQYQLEPVTARQGSGKRILTCRAFVCLYSDGTAPSTLLTFAQEPVISTGVNLVNDTSWKLRR